ncbi:DnaB-like helicase C-terminal domain-containing protein, partial [Bacillus sp. WP8]|uniref:DnaB-like helicase C-terminal domain-containing protein n=1 Tax=Bacillus sp. WP8 TaxID=756828 RepID=UPI0028D72026
KIGENVGGKREESVAMFSLEMGGEEVVMGMVCGEGNMNGEKLRRGNVREEEWGKVRMGMGSL